MKLAKQSMPRRNGAHAVEFAAVCSVFVLLMFGILEYCLITYTQCVVENAAREGCRYAVVNITDSTLVADTQAVVPNFLGGVNTKYQNYACNVYLADATGANIGSAGSAQFGQYVCVDVQVDYQPVTPGLLYLKTFTIRSKCIMISEAN